MKTLFVILFVAIATCVNANVTRNGNVFSTKSTRTAKDTLVTKYQYQDASGKAYPIIIIKSNGKCYVWKKSKKTGKMYKYYLSGKNAEISKTIAKELGIPYVDTKK